MNKIKFRIQNIHFIGIGGSGMNGIAEVLYNLGYVVSGSDISINKNTKRLESIGIKVYYNHQAQNIKNTQAVVVSSAISDDNPEIIAAKNKHIPVVPRAQMLAEIMRFRFGIAVSGTHGKTTTTSLISAILTSAKLDPTYIIGGILKSDGVGAKLGNSQYLIAEADESDGLFLHLQPMLSVITNIDRDHMQAYDNDYVKLQNAFIDFSANLPFYGLCVVCQADAGSNAIIPQITRPIVSYGLDDNADIYASNIVYQQNSTTFVVCGNFANFEIILGLIGEHNVLNALAAIAICLELKIAVKIIAKTLKYFKGIDRRMDFKGDLKINNKNIVLFDDYAHHPKEINAVIQGIRNSYVDKNLVVIFQPHRYSRSKDLFDDFVLELSKVDTLILLPIYSAGEDEIAGISSTALANAIRERAKIKVIVAKDQSDCFVILNNIAQNNDILLTIGAGNIVEIANNLAEKYGY